MLQFYSRHVTMTKIWFKKNNKKMIGKTITVLCEDFDTVSEVHYGRSYADAPDIDGKVYFRAPRRVMPGTFVKVKVEDMLDYDVIGTQITE